MGLHQTTEPNTVLKASNARLPLSEVRNLPNQLVRTRKSQALPKSTNEHVHVSDVERRHADVARPPASTLHRDSAHVQQKPQSTLVLQHDSKSSSRTRQHRPVSRDVPYSTTFPSFPFSSSSSHQKRSAAQATSNRSASKSLLPKPLSTSSTRGQNLKSQASSTRVRFPNPHSAPPNSDAAARWKQVRARLAGMCGPLTVKSPSVTGTSTVDSNTKFDEVLAYFKQSPGSRLNPQLSASITAETASTIASEIGLSVTANSSVFDIFIAVQNNFFRRTEQRTESKKPYDAWTQQPPTSEQLVLHGKHTMEQELNTASVTFGLDANRTWNRKFQREIPRCLRAAKVFNTNMQCAHFLRVIVGEGDINALRVQWIKQAEQDLTNQLSVRRANPKEDRWQLLHTHRYYGYLVTGLKLEVHEMVYQPNPTPMKTQFPPNKSQGALEGDDNKASVRDTALTDVVTSKHGTGPDSKASLEESSGKITSSHATSASIPGPSSSNALSQRARSLARTNSHSVVGSKANSRGTSSSAYRWTRRTQEHLPLTFSTSFVKSFRLDYKEDVMEFSKLHAALMRWAQGTHCAAFVDNLHELCWQSRDEAGNLWTMSNEEMHRYWDVAKKPQIDTIL